MEITNHTEENKPASEYVNRYEMPKGLKSHVELLKKTGGDFERISKKLGKRKAETQPLK